MVYEAIHSNSKFKKDAAVSSMSNIAVGFSRHSNKEFAQFLFISKSSPSEVQSILYVALDQSYIDKALFNKIYLQAEKVSKLNSGLINYLLKTRKNKERNTG
jgi:four helix bundle protein